MVRAENKLRFRNDRGNWHVMVSKTTQDILQVGNLENLHLLSEYIPDNAIVFADESHVSIPQLGGMFKGDFRRKSTLSEYGFRLPQVLIIDHLNLKSGML